MDQQSHIITALNRGCEGGQKPSVRQWQGNLNLSRQVKGSIEELSVHVCQYYG